MHPCASSHIPFVQVGGLPYVEITSAFFIRGDFPSKDGSFKHEDEAVPTVVSDAVTADVLNSKDWFTAAAAPVKVRDYNLTR